jgi:hypothetical protein
MTWACRRPDQDTNLIPYSLSEFVIVFVTCRAANCTAEANMNNNSQQQQALEAHCKGVFSKSGFITIGNEE